MNALTLVVQCTLAQLSILMHQGSRSGVPWLQLLFIKTKSQQEILCRWVMSPVEYLGTSTKLLWKWSVVEVYVGLLNGQKSESPCPHLCGVQLHGTAVRLGLTQWHSALGTCLFFEV